MSDQPLSFEYGSPSSLESLFPGAQCQWLHDQVLQVLPQVGTLLPAAVVQIPVSGDSGQALLDVLEQIGLSQETVGRPLLLLASDLTCQGAPKDALDRFIAAYPDGLHFCLSAAPAEWPDQAGIGLLPGSLSGQPVSNLIKWMQRFRLPSWCLVDSGYHAWVEHSADSGYLSALLLGADRSVLGAELTRLMAGPCTPTSFECFEFHVVRHIVQPHEPLSREMPIAQSFFRQPRGAVVASSDLELWQIEQAGDRSVIVTPSAQPGQLFGLIIRDATGHAILPID